MILLEHFDVPAVQPLVGKVHEGPIVYAERGPFVEVLWHYYGRKIVDSRCHLHAVNQPTEQHFSNIFAKERMGRDIPPDSLDNMLTAVPARCPIFDFNSWLWMSPQRFRPWSIGDCSGQMGRSMFRRHYLCSWGGLKGGRFRTFANRHFVATSDAFLCLPSSSQFASAPTTTAHCTQYAQSLVLVDPHFCRFHMVPPLFCITVLMSKHHNTGV